MYICGATARIMTNTCYRGGRGVHLREEWEAAFAKADAILALEGFEKTPAVAALQKAVSEGRMTIDEAVQHVIAEALAQRRA